MDKKKSILRALFFVLALLPIAIVGGLFTGVYSFEEFTPDVQKELIEQIGSKEIYYVVSVIQAGIYTIIFGILGYLLANKMGLIRTFRVQKRPLIITGAIALGCGIIFGMDNLTFGRYLPQVAQTYEKKPTLAYWIASVTYGGVVEEVMMRLFVMSLLGFILWKIFCRKEEVVPSRLLAIANVMAALLFAAGHIPATIQMFGELTPLILFRCFLLNSLGGVCFGYLYRKHGIQYAMLAHAGTHIVWKVIWVLFI